MRTKSSGLTLSAIALLLLVVLAGCSDGPPRLRSISVSPSTATITQSAPNSTSKVHVNSAVLDQQQFTATGLFGNGSTTDITGQVTWSSSNTAVATISSSGLATAVGPGTTTITATLLGVSGTATLTVTTVVSVTVTPANPTIASGATEQFVATATITNADGTPGTMDVSSDPSTTWTSLPTTVATITATGLATGAAQGTSTISATFGNATGSTTLTVGAARALSLVLTPATANIAVGNTVAFTALELWTDGTHPLSGTVTWSSDTAATATINPATGVALAAGIGTANITATEGSLTGTAAVTVVAAQARYAYLSNQGDSTISQYSVSAATGAFTPLTPATVPAQIPQQVVVSPNGLFAYSISQTPPTSSAVLFHIDPTTGLLSPSAPSVATQVGTGGFNHAAIDPTGQFLFVVDYNGDGSVAGTVGSYSIDQISGALTLVNTVATGKGPTDVLVDHTGKYLYVTNNADNNISEYSIATDGTLAALTPATVDGVDGPQFGAVDPANKYVYIPNGNPTPGTVSVYSIGTGGVLTSVLTTLTVPSAPVITGSTFLVNAAVDPTNKYVYFLDSPVTTGAVYGFNVTGTGALGAALPSSPYALSTSASDGTAPIGIAIDPTGTLVAVDNNGNGDISLLQDATTTGALTLSPTSPVVTGGGTGVTNPAFVVFYIAP